VKISIIDVASPQGVDSLREIWDKGPVGYSENVMVWSKALIERGHEVVIFGQTKREKEVEGIRIRPLPGYEEYKSEASMFFVGRAARADWAPFQITDAAVLQIAGNLKGPVLGFAYRPMAPIPKKWWVKNWGYLSFSKWHTSYMSQLGIPSYNILNVSLPMHPDNQFDEELAAKRPLLPRCLYASSWDRGLELLVKLWPKILEKCPEAELYIAYHHAEGKIVEDLRRQNIFIVGNLSFAKLKELYHSCHVLLYPCEEEVETFCYVTRKAQLAGCVPVVTPTGALPESVVEGGGIVASLDKFVGAAAALLNFKPFWEVRSRKCKNIPTVSPKEFAIRLEKAWETVDSMKISTRQSFISLS